jgi:peptidoglycan/xylan/chitin deacetylase (PgdA/CDA1 family)
MVLRVTWLGRIAEWPALFSAALAAGVLGACALLPRPAETLAVTTSSRPSAASLPTISPPAGVRIDRIIARNDRFAIYVPEAGDTLSSIARQFFGSEDLAWMISDFNGIHEPKPGQPLVVPLHSLNPTGILATGYQTVPILCYHRFGSEEDKMVVSPKAFAQQMEFLHRNGYRVVRLSELASFLEGKRQLPDRAVGITIDDGYSSMYQHAFPVLKRYGFPATIFIYTDFIGARDALTWEQMSEMVGSGLIDIQAHSKTHSNLTLRLQGESDSRYRERLNTEAVTPREILQRKLHINASSFAYPYGEANGLVMEQLIKTDYRMALTVNPGGNAFFTSPLLLHRTMILGDQDLETFKAQLHVFTAVDLR